MDILENTAVSLTATPNQDSSFLGWDGDCSGTGSCDLTINASKSVTVNFDLIPVSYPLSIEKIGTGDGDIYLDGALISCDGGCTIEIFEDTAVTLTASPDNNSTFAGWTGACEGTGACEFTMNSPKAITANFADAQVPIQFTLSIDLIGSGSGTLFLNGNVISCPASCAIDFDDNESVTLTASPQLNSTFVGWSGACTGTGFCDLIMDSDKDITVNFCRKRRPYCLSVGD